MTLVVLWQASGKTDEHEMNDLYSDAQWRMCIDI